LAERLHKSLDRAGTSDTLLIYIVTTHEKPFLKMIADKYKALYGSELSADIAKDTSGVRSIVVRFNDNT
jgi:hypothetical protein